MRTTVLVITWRGRDHLGDCLDALAAQDRAHRTLVVDNASDDGTADLLAGYPVEVLRLPRNAGYAGGIAAALRKVETPFVAWLNDDAAPEPGWLAHLEDTLDADPQVGAAASHLLTLHGRTQSLGTAVTTDGHGQDVPAVGAERGFRPTRRCESHVHPTRAHESHFQLVPRFGFCGGAVLLRVAALLAVGGVPGTFFCYYEDLDTSWRLRLAGYEVVAVPGARVRHRHGASTRPGSRRFHRWNERNRLLTLLRCAPRGVAAREAARFLAVTLALPFRERNQPANYTVGLRVRVLTEVLALLPAALLARRHTGPPARKRAVWRTWAGTLDLDDTVR